MSALLSNSRDQLLALQAAPIGGLPALQGDLDRAASFARAEKAESTRRAYRTDFDLFKAWAAERGVCALPASPESAAAFLASEADRRIAPSTISRRVAAIRYAHRLAGHAVPTDDERVRAVVRGIRREKGVAPRKKAPATSDRLIAMAAAGDGGLASLRDRALLLIGFSGAFRRSELVALDVADIQQTVDGILVTIRRSKTDQEAAGTIVAIVRGEIACPVQALRAWLDRAGITEGPIFRPVSRSEHIRNTRLTDRSVANIVKNRAARVGLDATAFSGHSLRAGFATSAAARGANLFKIMDQTRHKSVDTLRGYVRSAEAFKDHADAGLL